LPGSCATKRQAEKLFWHFLRVGKLGAKFRRQAAIGPYIVDFICFARQIVVELDGPQHLDPAAKEYDVRRTAWLESRGFRVLRFRNQTLNEKLGEVVEKIQRALLANKAPSPTLPARGREPEGL